MKARTPARRTRGHQWTALGRRLGYTTDPSQRATIMAATERMTWSGPAAGADASAGTVLAQQVVRLTAMAVLHPSRLPTRLGSDEARHRFEAIGVGALPAGRWLVGLDDGTTRSYLLVAGYEVVTVLSERRDGRTAPDAA